MGTNFQVFCGICTNFHAIATLNIYFLALSNASISSVSRVRIFLGDIMFSEQCVATCGAIAGYPLFQVFLIQQDRTNIFTAGHLWVTLPDFE